MIEVFADKRQLRKALAKLEALEERGLDASLAVFNVKGEDRIEFNDQFIVKADESDPDKNFGRMSVEMVKYYRYHEDGKLVSIY